MTATSLRIEDCATKEEAADVLASDVRDEATDFATAEAVVLPGTVTHVVLDDAVVEEAFEAGDVIAKDKGLVIFVKGV